MPNLTSEYTYLHYSAKIEHGIEKVDNIQIAKIKT